MGVQATVANKGNKNVKCYEPSTSSGSPRQHGHDDITTVPQDSLHSFQLVVFDQHACRAIPVCVREKRVSFSGFFVCSGRAKIPEIFFPRIHPAPASYCRNASGRFFTLQKNIAPRGRLLAFLRQYAINSDRLRLVQGAVRGGQSKGQPSVFLKSHPWVKKSTHGSRY